MITATIITSCLFATSPQWATLFNGKNLDGWTIVNGATSTWTVQDNMIICSGKPTSVLRTNQQYENFILDFDWRHAVKNGNAGLFVWSDPYPAIGVPFTRSIEVQIMDGKELDWYTTHGDIFSIWGAKMTPDDPHPHGEHVERCLPSERRSNPAPEWNHYTVTCIDGQINLSVNGAFVSGGYDITPNKGYICLEAEGTEAHFRNMKIMELPPSAPPTKDAANDDFLGFQTLYTGVNLDGWKTDEQTKEHWEVKGWILSTSGNAATLMTSKEYPPFELALDYRCAKEHSSPYVIVDGKKQYLPHEPDKKWKRKVISGTSGNIGIGSDTGSVDFCNIFIRTQPNQ